jgi:hypothetical protein
MRRIGLTAAAGFVLATVLVACTMGFGAVMAAACTPGEEACPVVLKMRPGAVSITVAGAVSLAKPAFFFSFDANAGQSVVIHTTGAVLRGQAPFTAPNGDNDAFDLDQPYKLPTSGTYTFSCLANTQAEDSFGKFRMTLTIK